MADTFKQSVAARDDEVSIVLPQSTNWAFINEWRVEPQANDRTPMSGERVSRTKSPSASRSVARRKRQAMFKEWSQDRHE